MRFFKDIKKYFGYTKYAAKSALNAEVAGSYLNWLWWVFNPLCMMFIYTFIFGYVFDGRMEYAPIYIFIGLTVWDFFNRTVNESIKIVKKNKSIVTKVYLPKFILIETSMMVNFVKMLISFAIIISMMIVFQVPISWNVLWVIPVFVVLAIFTFGISCLLMHFGVFIEDLSNIIRILLRFIFYATGIFYSIEKKFGAPWNEILIKYNPMAFLMNGVRKALLSCSHPDLKWLLIWLGISLLICVIGVKTVYKYENSYAKAI